MVEKKKRGDDAKDAGAKKPARPKRAGQPTTRGTEGGASERPRLRSTVTSKSEGASRRRTMKTTVQTRGDEPTGPKKKLLAPKRALAPRDRDGHRGPPTNGRAQGRVPAGRALDGSTARRKSLPPPVSTADDRSRELAIAIATAGLEKKAIGVEVLDVSGRVDYADFLVIMTGTSDRHVHAIATGIEEALRKSKQRPLSVEGLQLANWVLIDFDDVVVHVFQEETRRVYDIEGLWMDAGRVDVETAQA